MPPPYSGSTSATSMATLDGFQNSPSTMAGLQQLLTFDNGVQLVQASNGILARGNQYANTLTGLLSNVKLQTQFPANNGLAAQLRTVANVMAGSQSAWPDPPDLLLHSGGFDTHSEQLETQTPLLQQLSQAVAAFYTATKELGIDSSVTTFTASEFGRTLTPSGADGSDHAWGNHHFIVGSGVAGGRFYGSFPLLTPGGANDANTRGVLIPHHRGGSVRIHSGAMVRRATGQLADGLPEHRQLRHQPARVPRLAPEEMARQVLHFLRRLSAMGRIAGRNARGQSAGARITKGRIAAIAAGLILIVAGGTAQTPAPQAPLPNTPDPHEEPTGQNVPTGSKDPVVPDQAVLDPNRYNAQIEPRDQEDRRPGPSSPSPLRRWTRKKRSSAGGN